METKITLQVLPKVFCYEEYFLGQFRNHITQLEKDLELAKQRLAAAELRHKLGLPVIEVGKGFT